MLSEVELWSIFYFGTGIFLLGIYSEDQVGRRTGKYETLLRIGIILFWPIIIFFFLSIVIILDWIFRVTKIEYEE